MTPSAVLVSQPELDRWSDPGFFLGLGKHPQRLFTIDRIDECHGVLANDVLCVGTQHRRYGRADVADGAASFEDDDDVRGVLNQRAKAFLASPERVFHLLALGNVSADG